MTDHTEAAQPVDLPVRYIRNPVSGTWAYVIELSSILGGCFPSREEAEEHAIVSLATLLQRPPRVAGHHEELGYLRLHLPPAGHIGEALGLHGQARFFDGPLVTPTRQRLGAA